MWAKIISQLDSVFMFKAVDSTSLYCFRIHYSSTMHSLRFSHSKDTELNILENNYAGCMNFGTWCTIVYHHVQLSTKKRKKNGRHWTNKKIFFFVDYQSTLLMGFQHPNILLVSYK